MVSTGKSLRDSVDENHPTVSVLEPGTVKQGMTMWVII